MKILNFISGKDLGGPKHSFILYNKAFEALGYENISLIRRGASLAKLLKQNSQPFIDVSYIRTTNKLFKKSSVRKLKKAITKVNPDTIFVHKQIDIELVREAVGDNVKIIGVVHGFNAKHIDGADALIAVSKKVKDFLKKSGYKKDIYIVPNMVEIVQEPHIKPIRTPVHIGTMGVFRRKKGFHIFIEALKILKSRDIDFKATIAGRGRRIVVYKYLCKKYNLCSNLEFKDWIKAKDRDAFFDSLDIYVLPSRTESFGMVVVEAMARKKIVVATKCGGPQEIIDDKIDGFLVENQSPKAIADALEHIIKAKDLSQIQEKAYKKAFKEYGVESVKFELDKILKSYTNENI